MVGPLAPHVRGFAAELTGLGFTTFFARGQLGLAVCLSRWLTETGLDLAVVTDAVVDSFLAARRAAGYTAYLTSKALIPLLGYLCGMGVAPDAVPVARPSGVEELLGRFGCYLLVERGVRDKVASCSVASVCLFVEQVGADRLGLRKLSAGEVSVFLVVESRRLTPKTTQRTATALRSLLRWWYLGA
jgi:hypothetical protein